MVRDHRLNVPVIGIARQGWTKDQLCARMRDSLAAHGGIDDQAYTQLVQKISYVSGDYADPATFDRLREALGRAVRPVFYLAIPPSLFGPVAAHLAQCARCRDDAREQVALQAAAGAGGHPTPDAERSWASLSRKAA